MVIPLDVVMLIEAYFDPNKPQMNLFRIQESNGDIFNFCQMSQWNQISWNQVVDGFIFVVDLMWYDKYIVDEHGQRRNKLEHAISQWNHHDSDHRDENSPAFRIMLLMNLESFVRKSKEVAPSVCPLFSDVRGVFAPTQLIGEDMKIFLNGSRQSFQCQA